MGNGNGDRMGPRAYAAYEKTFMLFGSLAKSFAPGVPVEDWQVWADQWLHWAREQATELVDGAYNSEKEKAAEPAPPEGEKEEGVINANQAKRFYTIAYNEGGYTQEGIKRLLKKHGLTSAYKMKTRMYEAFCSRAKSKSLAADCNKGEV
jgi:hypothetical protein